MAEYKSNVEPLINATFDQYRARNEREDEAIRIKLRDQIKARDSELVASKSEIVALKTAANLNQTELSKRTALIAGLKVSNANLSQACIDLDTLVKDVKAKLNSSQNEVKDLVSKNVALTNAVNRLDVKREQSKVKAKCADLEAQVKQLTAELIAAKCHIAELKFDSNMVPGLAAELAKVNAQVELIPQLKKDLEDKESVVIQLRSELEKVTMFVEPSSHASDFNDLVVAKEVARDFEHSEAKVQENEDSDLKTMTERINSLTTENDYLKEKVERFMTVLVLKANVLINKP
jgi:chromosome segregation ATPase